MAKRTTAKGIVKGVRPVGARPNYMAAVDACDEIAGRLGVALVLLQTNADARSYDKGLSDWASVVAGELVRECQSLASEAESAYESGPGDAE